MKHLASKQLSPSSTQKRKKLEPSEPIDPLTLMLQSDLQKSAEQEPSELLHLLSNQPAPPSGPLLDHRRPPTKDEVVDSLRLQQESVSALKPEGLELRPKQGLVCHLPYTKKIVVEDADLEGWKARVTNKFAVDERLVKRSTLERVSLVKSVAKYAQHSQGDIVGDKTYEKYHTVDVLSLLNTYADLMVEYGNTPQPEFVQRACVFHLLNHVLRRDKVISYDDTVFAELEGIETGKKKLDLKDFEDPNEKDPEDAGEEDKKEEEKSESDSEPEKEEAKDPDEAGWDMVKKEGETDGYNKHLKAISETKNKEDKYELVKDQGLTKGKVLILCPFKLQAFEIVNELVMQFKGKWKGVVKKKKFKDEYGSPEEAANDCFRLGISFYGKTMKLYSQFRKSDIIIASPLGLKTIIQEGESNMKYDFLSSIEVLMLDHAHLFLYQNIDHLEEILKNVNELPTKTEGLTDINRIMNVFLDNKAKLLRQTIFLTKYTSLELGYLFKTASTNYFGRMSLPYDYPCGLSKDLILQNKTVYLRKIAVGDLETAAEKRFEFFTKKIWPKLYESMKTYTIIYVPLYFDFVRLKKFFK